MKKILFLIFYLASGVWNLTCAQLLTFDSTWQQKIDTNYYVFRKTVYADGSEYLSKVFSGNDSTVFDNALKTSINEGVRMANVAYEARDLQKSIKAIIDLSDSLFVQTGKNLSDTLTMLYSPALTVSGWKITEGGVTLDIVFSVSGGGALRYEITGFSERAGEVISNTLRLNNYKSTGKSVDIYRAPGGNWFSVTNEIKMKFPGNTGD